MYYAVVLVHPTAYNDCDDHMYSSQEYLLAAYMVRC